MSDRPRIFTRTTAATRIRRKLILLHTVFSVSLSVVLILASGLIAAASEYFRYKSEQFTESS